MTEDKSVCKGGPKLIFACSGAADVGEITDKAARKLTKDGVGMMFCTAGIGGRVENIMKKTESAEKIIAVDGCGLDCVKNSLEKAGFDEFVHVQLAALGLVKGNSPATEENVQKVVSKVSEM